MANKAFKAYLKKVTHLSLQQIKHGITLVEEPPAIKKIDKPKKIGKKSYIALDFEKEPIEAVVIDHVEEE